MDGTDIGHRAAKAEMGLRLFQSLCQRPDIGQFPTKLAKHPVNTAHAQTIWLDESTLTTLMEPCLLQTPKGGLCLSGPWKNELLRMKRHSTATWLVFKCTNGDRYHVARLKCFVCMRFKSQLEGMRNYNLAFIDGLTHVKTSRFKGHASTEMHKIAMDLHRKSESDYNIQATPIAKGLHHIDSGTLDTL